MIHTSQVMTNGPSGDTLKWCYQIVQINYEITRKLVISFYQLIPSVFPWNNISMIYDWVIKILINLRTNCMHSYFLFQPAGTKQEYLNFLYSYAILSLNLDCSFYFFPSIIPNLLFLILNSSANDSPSGFENLFPSLYILFSYKQLAYIFISIYRYFSR